MLVEMLTAGAKQQPIGQNLRSSRSRSSRSSSSSTTSSRSSWSRRIRRRVASTQKAFEALACQSTHCYNALTLIGRQTEHNSFQIGCLQHGPDEADISCHMPSCPSLQHESRLFQAVALNRLLIWKYISAQVFPKETPTPMIKLFFLVATGLCASFESHWY